MPTPSRTELVDAVAQASLRGSLGLFVGTGFSRAATNGVAPTFEELLVAVAEDLGVDMDLDEDWAFQRKSYPQIASQLLAVYKETTDPSRAETNFRESIARKTHLAPDAAFKDQLSAAFSTLLPSWVITTNYDLILESIVETAESVLPDEPLVPNASRLPIYHLHGHRHYPHTIKVTEEDYVHLLGPLDYQRLKLPLLLAESVTVMLGYALGDMNVRAALAWAGSFTANSSLRVAGHRSVVIQALYTRDTPQPDPYLGPNGEYIVETDDVAALLSELADRRSDLEAETRAARTAIREFLDDPANAESVVVDDDARAEFLEIIGSTIDLVSASTIINFMNRALEPTWDRARASGGFEYYDDYLRLLLDVLERVDHRGLHPALFTYLADSLDRLGWFVDPTGGRALGTSFRATRRWQAENARINKGLFDELDAYSEVQDRGGLDRLLDLA